MYFSLRLSTEHTEPPSQTLGPAASQLYWNPGTSACCHGDACQSKQRDIVLREANRILHLCIKVNMLTYAAAPLHPHEIRTLHAQLNFQASDRASAKQGVLNLLRSEHSRLSVERDYIPVPSLPACCWMLGGSNLLCPDLHPDLIWPRPHVLSSSCGELRQSYRSSHLLCSALVSFHLGQQLSVE